MSDGHGCDAGGHHCGAGASHADGGGYALAGDGKTPIPNIKRVEINGAPVTEATHEFVIRKPNAQH